MSISPGGYPPSRHEPPPKPPIDKKVFLIVLAIAIGTFTVWGTFLWAIGAVDYAVKLLDKKTLGYISAGAFIMLYLAIFSFREHRR